MSLIATARALEDQRFLWRVRAATLELAITKYQSTTANDKALAQEILDMPMLQNRTMEALVACQDTISAAITVDANNTVNTEAVTDAMITSAVATYWTPVANRRAEIRAAAAASSSTP
jgi:hypothetical protein